MTKTTEAASRAWPAIVSTRPLGKSPKDRAAQRRAEQTALERKVVRQRDLLAGASPEKREKLRRHLDGAEQALADFIGDGHGIRH